MRTHPTRTGPTRNQLIPTHEGSIPEGLKGIESGFFILNHFNLACVTGGNP
jgi:hypothetical protein